jgi:hypothetical protein
LPPTEAPAALPNSWAPPVTRERPSRPQTATRTRLEIPPAPRVISKERPASSIRAPRPPRPMSAPADPAGRAAQAAPTHTLLRDPETIIRREYAEWKPLW